MFNIGPGELIAISMVALLVLGPQRLPHAVRTVGRVVGELRRISSGFQDELRGALDDSELDQHPTRRSTNPPSLPPLIQSGDDPPPAAIVEPAAPAEPTPIVPVEDRQDAAEPAELPGPAGDDVDDETPPAGGAASAAS